MLKRDDWLDLARKLDWELSYVAERGGFPRSASGTPWLPHAAWRGLGRAVPHHATPSTSPTSTTRRRRCRAVREAVGRRRGLPDACRAPGSTALKLHAATLPLAEFAAVIGNLRAARFGRDSAWRTTAPLGALDELRHTQIPLAADARAGALGSRSSTGRTSFYHTNNWVAIAARHLVDELLLASNPIEFAIAHQLRVRDRLHQPAVRRAVGAGARASATACSRRWSSSIQSDEARHAQIGAPVLAHGGRARSRRTRSTWSTSGSGAAGCCSRW